LTASSPALARRHGFHRPLRRLTVACASAVLLGAFTLPASSQTYGIGVMQPGTLNNSTGAAIAKVMQQKLGFQTRLQPNAGETTLLPLVNMGELDFGIANVLEVSEAFEGAGRAGKQANLQVVAAIHPLRVAFFVRKDAPIHTVADLKGKRVPLGFAAMRTIDTLAQAGLAAGGLTVTDVKPVLVPNVIRSADDFMSGAADAFFFALGAGKVSEADASVGGIRPLPMPDSPEALAAAQKIFKYLYFSDMAPRPGLAGVTAPGKILSYDNLLVAGSHVKDEVVYKVLAALEEHKGDLVATAPWLSEFSAAQAYKAFPIPYHPSAVRYFKDKNIPQK
jgi:TRAP transporter TAXI family solute receptor